MQILQGPLSCSLRMKVATWNVNGIRGAVRLSSASGSSASRPTSSACRRSRRRPTRCPACCSSRRTTSRTGTATAATPASRCMLRRSTFPAPTTFTHPPFDLESRIVVAEVGSMVFALGLRPERRQGPPREDGVPARAGCVGRGAAGRGQAPRAVRRPQRRAHRHRRPPDAAQADDRSERRRARR